MTTAKNELNPIKPMSFFSFFKCGNLMLNVASLQKCKSEKLQRHEKRCEILTKKANRTHISDKCGQITFRFCRGLDFYFFDRRTSFVNLRSSVKVSY